MPGRPDCRLAGRGGRAFWAADGRAFWAADRRAFWAADRRAFWAAGGLALRLPRAARYFGAHRARACAQRAGYWPREARIGRIVSVGSLVSSGPLILAVPVAAAAGAVTFLSPCCLPLVPGYLSYVAGMSGAGAARGRPRASGSEQAGAGEVTAQEVAVPQATARALAGPRSAGGAPALAGAGAASASAPVLAAPPRSRVVAGTALFVLGFSALYTSYGLALGRLGTTLKSHQTGLTLVLGTLTIVLGLLFAGVLDRFSFAGRIMRPTLRPRAGLAGAPLLGVMFGLSWSPCIGPTLTAVLALAYTSGTAARGAFLAFIYCLGLGIPFLIVALAFQRGMRVFGFARRHARLVTGIGGGMLVLVGVLEVTGAWTAALTWMQIHWFLGDTSPI
jgi:cytochrome c-type biogenesis protein